MHYTAKVVYSRRYRHCGDDNGADIAVPMQAKESLKNFRRRLNEWKYVAIPEKQERSKVFLDLAKGISERLQLDIDILETACGYTANLYMDCTAYPRDMTRVLAQLIYISDGMSVFIQPDEESGFTLSLDFYTREKCQNAQDL